jgi:hypothetical protein
LKANPQIKAQIFSRKGEKMNKIIIILFVMITILPYHAFGQNVPNYEISINEKKYDISLGCDYQIKSDSGETFHFRVNKKAVMTYKNKRNYNP